MIAQRVSAGFHPHMKTQPQRGDRTPVYSSLPRPIYAGGVEAKSPGPTFVWD